MPCVCYYQQARLHILQKHKKLYLSAPLRLCLLRRPLENWFPLCSHFHRNVYSSPFRYHKKINSARNSSACKTVDRHKTFKHPTCWLPVYWSPASLVKSWMHYSALSSIIRHRELPHTLTFVASIRKFRFPKNWHIPELLVRHFIVSPTLSLCCWCWHIFWCVFLWMERCFIVFVLVRSFLDGRL